MRFANVVFPPYTSNHLYSYIIPETVTIAAGDYVVVQTPNRDLKVCKVVSVVDNIELQPGITYRPLLCAVDFSAALEAPEIRVSITKQRL